MLSCGLRRPILHRAAVNLNRGPAIRAHQVMVVLLICTRTVQHLTRGGVERIDLAGVGQTLQRSIHRGQTNPGTLLNQTLIHILRRHKIINPIQQLHHRTTLTSAPLTNLHRTTRRNLYMRSGRSKICRARNSHHNLLKN